eukprot:1181870-Rhodomonas_salina.1
MDGGVRTTRHCLWNTRIGTDIPAIESVRGTDQRRFLLPVHHDWPSSVDTVSVGPAHLSPCSPAVGAVRNTFYSLDSHTADATVTFLLNSTPASSSRTP